MPAFLRIPLFYAVTMLVMVSLTLNFTYVLYLAGYDLPVRLGTSLMAANLISLIVVRAFNPESNVDINWRSYSRYQQVLVCLMGVSLFICFFLLMATGVKFIPSQYSEYLDPKLDELLTNFFRSAVLLVGTAISGALTFFLVPTIYRPQPTM